MTIHRAKSTIFAPDNDLMRLFNRWRAPRWFRWWMLLATRAEDGRLWGLIGIAVFLSRNPFAFKALEAAACAVVAGIILFHNVKRLVCRIRPRDVEPPCWAHIVTAKSFRFPPAAANVAISRLVIGMHFLSDVVVGSGTGALLGYVAFRFACR